ncbi:MAG: hypothetical protein ACM3TU_03745 [Bacillota bacterium]
MSKFISNRFIGVTSILAGAALIGASLYGGNALVQMLNEEIAYGGTLISLGADAARGVETTLYPGPAERFLGSGTLGMVAPTILAILGTIFFIYGWNRLEPANYEDDDLELPDDPEHLKAPTESPTSDAIQPEDQTQLPLLPAEGTTAEPLRRVA